MTTATALSISHAARVGADLFDRAAAAGLPTNLSLRAHREYVVGGYREAVTFQFYGDFGDVHAWAKWLGVEAVEKVSEHDDAVTFCDAYADVEGVRVRLTANETAAR